MPLISRFAALATLLALATPVTAWGTPYSDAVTSAGPIAYWRFEDASAANGATATDATGNYNGSYVNNSGFTTNTAPYLGGQAVNFDPTNRQIKVSTQGSPATSLGSLGSSLETSGAGVTFEFWLRSGLTTSDQRLFGTFNSSTGTTITMVANSGAAGRTQLFIRGDLNASGGTGDSMTATFGNSTTNNLYNGNWNHVVWQLNDLATNGLSTGLNNPFLLWINGQSVALSYSGNLGTAAFFSDFDNPFWIGGAGRGSVISPNLFTGQFDEFAIYNRLLTPAEIQSHYQLATVPEPSSLALFGLGALGLMLRRRRKAVC